MPTTVETQVEKEARALAEAYVGAFNIIDSAHHDLTNAHYAALQIVDLVAKGHVSG